MKTLKTITNEDGTWYYEDSVNCDECILLKMVELAERDTQA